MSKSQCGLERQAEILKALGHPVRLQIMRALLDRPWCVCDLAEELGIRQPYLSQQLARLRRAGLVSGTRGGLQVEYRVDVPNVEDLLKAVDDVVGAA